MNQTFQVHDEDTVSNHIAMLPYVGGIDPGKTGAFVVLEIATGRIEGVLRVPLIRKKGSKKAKPNFAPDFVSMASEWGHAIQACRHIYVENVWGAAPAGRRQGGTGMFNFGFIAGFIRGMILAWGHPFTLVAPQKWKRYYHLTGAVDKTPSLELARSMWPLAAHELKRKKDDGVAEAALIAEYGRTLEVACPPEE